MASRELVGIKQLGKDKWFIRYDVYDINGNRVQKSEVFTGTKRDAIKRREELRTETRKTKVPVKMTIGELMEKWFAFYQKGKRTASRIEEVGIRINTHIVPKLGKKKLGDLTTDTVQEFIESIDRKPRTIRGVFETLNAALRYAVKRGYMADNPCTNIELPPLGKPEIKWWTANQTRKFLQTAKTSRFYVLYKMAIGTGMRQGELLALCWQDIDFENRRLFVRRTLHWKKGGGWEFAPPKTQRSLRSIPLSVDLLAALKAHKKKQDIERLHAGPAWDDYDLVFANGLGHPFNPRNIRNRDFKKQIKNAGVPPIRFHDLRHTYATLALERGMHIKVLSARLGHASEAFTMSVYAGSSPSLEEGTANILDDVLNV